MLQFAGMIYGLLTTFVLSSAMWNHRQGRAHPPILVYLGYILCGLSAGAALLLPIWSLLGYEVLPPAVTDLI